jgi:hypothetical protein
VRRRLRAVVETEDPLDDVGDLVRDGHRAGPAAERSLGATVLLQRDAERGHHRRGGSAEHHLALRGVGLHDVQAERERESLDQLDICGVRTHRRGQFGARHRRVRAGRRVRPAGRWPRSNPDRHLDPVIRVDVADLPPGRTGPFAAPHDPSSLRRRHRATSWDRSATGSPVSERACGSDTDTIRR